MVPLSIILIFGIYDTESTYGQFHQYDGIPILESSYLPINFKFSIVGYVGQWGINDTSVYLLSKYSYYCFFLLLSSSPLPSISSSYIDVFNLSYYVCLSDSSFFFSSRSLSTLCISLDLSVFLFSFTSDS